jgi:hypothetical protein
MMATGELVKREVEARDRTRSNRIEEGSIEASKQRVLAAMPCTEKVAQMKADLNAWQVSIVLHLLASSGAAEFRDGKWYRID